MRIIVLGSTGYLGSHIVKALVKEGHDVLCLIRKESSRKNLDAVIDKVRVCDIEQLSEMIRCEPPYDFMLNAACRYPHNASSDIDIFDANLFVPLKIFLECVDCGVQSFITIGTGLPDDFNTYALSKKKLADIMRWFMEQYKVSGIQLHICNVELQNFYGEDEPEDRFIPGTVRKLKENAPVLLTDGKQIRDFIYVEDAINAIVKLFQADLPEYMDFPLGTGEGVAVRDLITYLKKILNSDSELYFGAIDKRRNEPDAIADCMKMREYGVKIKYSWRDGLKKFV